MARERSKTKTESYRDIVMGIGAGLRSSGPGTPLHAAGTAMFTTAALGKERDDRDEERENKLDDFELSQRAKREDRRDVVAVEEEAKQRENDIRKGMKVHKVTGGQEAAKAADTKDFKMDFAKSFGGFGLKGLPPKMWSDSDLIDVALKSIDKAVSHKPVAKKKPAGDPDLSDSERDAVDPYRSELGGY